MQRYVRSWEQAGLLSDGIIVAAWESISLRSGAPKAFSSEVDTGSRKENAPNQKTESQSEATSA
jgi:hypothetical protein